MGSNGMLSSTKSRSSTPTHHPQSILGMSVSVLIPPPQDANLRQINQQRNYILLHLSNTINSIFFCLLNSQSGIQSKNIIGNLIYFCGQRSLFAKRKIRANEKKILEKYIVMVIASFEPVRNKFFSFWNYFSVF